MSRLPKQPKGPKATTTRNNSPRGRCCLKLAFGSSVEMRTGAMTWDAAHELWQEMNRICSTRTYSSECDNQFPYSCSIEQLRSRGKTAPAAPPAEYLKLIRAIGIFVGPRFVLMV